MTARASTHRTSRAPFETVVARHGTTVLRVARAVVGPVDADDAWSETFLAAMKAYPDLPEGANVEAWLVTIAHRKAVDIVRAASRRPVPVSNAPDKAAGALDEGRDLDLDDAIAALTAKQRQAIAYHYLAGLPYDEIAGITGSTATAVRRAASDGVAALRRAYPKRPSEKQEHQ